jgi:hypothetical protein
LTSTATGSLTAASPRLFARPKPMFSSSAMTTTPLKLRAIATVSSLEPLSTTTVRTPGRYRATERSRSPTCTAELWVTVTSAKSWDMKARRLDGRFHGPACRMNPDDRRRIGVLGLAHTSSMGFALRP